MNSFPLRNALICGVALAAVSSASAHAQSGSPAAASARHSPFDAAVAFGDSLSDGGNTSLSAGETTIMRFTTNPGRTAVEDLAARYGVPLSPSLAGGGDYAYGGAGVVTNGPGQNAAIPTETAQITGYLAAHPAADPHALYTVFGGANDVFNAETSTVAYGIAQQLIAGATAGQSPAQAAATSAAITKAVAGIAGVASLQDFPTATATIAAAGQAQGAQVARLQAAGARSIVVFNLPDIGLTPQATGEGAAIAGQLTQLSSTFNAALNADIATHPHGVIPVDAFDLIRETLAAPQAFGFVNATVPACTTASSFNCTPQTLRAPDAASTYFFADGIHPTTATHALLAQAIASEIAAPAYISLLAEAPLAASTAQRDVWGQELAVDGADPAARSRAFARIDYDSQTFHGGRYAVGADDDGGVATLGFDWRPAPRLSLGATVTGARSFADFADRYAKFRGDTLMASAFGQYRVGSGGYLNAAAGAGRLDFDDISRSFDLGPFRQGEHGATDGLIFTGTLTAGWWFGGPMLKLSPYAQLQYDHVHVGGYAEDGTDATAMTFGPQTREAVVGEFGVRAQGVLRTPWGELRPYAALAYDHDGRADVRTVEAGLVDMAGSFTLPGYDPSANWGSAQAGVEWRFAPAWSATVGYQGRFGDGAEELNVATVGVKRSF